MKCAQEMQHLVQYADVLTPNLTELCKLLDIAYPSETPTLQRIIFPLCETLAQKGSIKNSSYRFAKKWLH